MKRLFALAFCLTVFLVAECGQQKAREKPEPAKASSKKPDAQAFPTSERKMDACGHYDIFFCQQKIQREHHCEYRHLKPDEYDFGFDEHTCIAKDEKKMSACLDGLGCEHFGIETQEAACEEEAANCFGRITVATQNYQGNCHRELQGCLLHIEENYLKERAQKR